MTMSAGISIIRGRRAGGEVAAFLSPAAVAPAAQFHRSLPLYAPTPLVALPGLAARLAVGQVFVKDESRRFGLNAFKGLGASWAIAKIIARMVGESDACPDFARLTAADVRARVAGLTFVTATDGNHGKGVAWAASIFGCRAVVFMPKGSRECRAEAIRRVNDTRVEVTDYNYDDTVRLAAAYARREGWHLVQDTGLAGYEEIPNFITQGYTTMAAEALAQLAAAGVEKPSHVFLQAGVGSMAGGVLGYLAHYYQGRPPLTTIVEPATVACIYASVRAGDGRPHAIGGNPVTIMAGLNCGEPNPFTWPILRDYAAFFASCPDWVAECGMRTLARPRGGDAPVVAGESGAVGLGLLAALGTDASLAAYREMLALDAASTVLVFNTEGDTDPEAYAAIVNKQEKGKGECCEQ